jgi:hypothetical protein
MVDCNEMRSTYKDSLITVAYQEFMGYYHNDKNDGEPEPMSGSLKCFCQAEADDGGAYSVLGKTYSVKGKAP